MPTAGQHITRPGEPFLDGLKIYAVADENCQGLDVESDVVLPAMFWSGLPQKIREACQGLAEVMQDTPWRYQQYGEQIVKVISGKEVSEMKIHFIGAAQDGNRLTILAGGEWQPAAAGMRPVPGQAR